MMNDDAIVFITQWVFSYVNAVQTTLPYDLIAVHTAKLIQMFSVSVLKAVQCHVPYLDICP